MEIFGIDSEKCTRK